MMNLIHKINQEKNELRFKALKLELPLLVNFKESSNILEMSTLLHKECKDLLLDLCNCLDHLTDHINRKHYLKKALPIELDRSYDSFLPSRHSLRKKVKWLN